MLDVVIEEDGKPPRSVTVARFPCRIGKARDSEVALASWRVGRVHAEIHRVGRSLKLVDLGTLGGTQVNGDRIVEYGPLSERDQIVIAGYRLRVHGEALRAPAAAAALLSGAPVPTMSADPSTVSRSAIQSDAPAEAPSRVEQMRREQLAALPWRRLVHRRLPPLLSRVIM